MTVTGGPSAGPRPLAPWPSTPATHPRRQRSQLAMLLLATDAVCVLGVVLLLGQGGPAVLVFSASVLAVHAAVGLYRPRLDLSVLDDLPLLLGSAVAAIGVAAIGGGALGLGEVDGGTLLAALVQTGLVVAARTAAYVARRRTRISGQVAHRTLVVGCGGLGAQLVEIFRSGEHGLLPVGFIDDAPRLSAEDRPLPVLGGIADLAETVRRHGIVVVVIAYSNAPEMVVVDVLRGCQDVDVEILVVPRFWQVTSTHRSMQTARGVPMVQLRRPAFRAATWPLKRVVDVGASAVALLLLSPVVAACALALRLEVGPGVLFRQERVGIEGRRFELLKLRTLRTTTAESDTRWSVDGDDRVGPVGRWLRKLSLDELPQLWNVLRGDMSLVGPRPERPHFVERFTLEHDGYLWRHRVPVGVTGWAQVNGLRGDTSIADRARFDNHYVENWSLWLDVKILLRTVVQVVTAAGR
ncbi:exopolysaccharide biosynthesis polyprenyl glycosylphosphotransferase [Kineococcus radiotolerans]|uniref:Exopolysaccharide biosynthesis polyprenyl glycosylphosphotransferase n=1 Tax=Kineococcus radiotolerans TaxID=131568 RepID=A0A7W4TLY5_KINRA|nr:sugar transferase [Kineococcus radiotolerans]MBB2901364.1 exopolysaccharide biosynthesis polyprenyl glycosylphosphotransferase [Kineococcus radiotolerans]